MRRLAIALVSLFLFACDREPVAPDVSPSFDWTNAPPNSGIVFRGVTGIGIWIADPEAGVGAIQGGDVVEYCQTGGTTFPLVEWQDVVSPSDEGRILELFKGSGVNTTVWPFTEFDCALFTSVSPIAAGPVHIVNTDNDVYAWLFEHQNVNAFGWAAQGRLMRMGGGFAHYNAVLKVVWDPAAGRYHDVQRINFR